MADYAINYRDWGAINGSITFNRRGHTLALLFDFSGKAMNFKLALIAVLGQYGTPDVTTHRLKGDSHEYFQVSFNVDLRNL